MQLQTKAVGRNTSGQLGDGAAVNRTSIVELTTLSGVQQVCAGSNHTIFVLDDGTVKATGDNAYSKLGIGTAVENIKIPTTVLGLE